MEASTREFLRGLLKNSFTAAIMLKGLLSVFDDREVSFFILVLSDFDPAEKCVFVLSFDKGNSSLY